MWVCLFSGQKLLRGLNDTWAGREGFVVAGGDIIDMDLGPYEAITYT